MANNDLVSSLLKGLDILRVVAEQESPVKLFELSEMVGMKLTTVRNLLRTLCARNFLVKDDEGFYSLGQAVPDIAQYYQDRSMIMRVKETMQQLVEKLESSTVVFSELKGPEICLALRYSPDRPFVLQRPHRQTYQPYANASGLVVLAYAEERKLEQLHVRYPFSEYGAHLWKDETKLEQYLKDVYKTGYAVCPFDTDKTMRVAVPVLDKKGKINGILGISIPALKNPKKEDAIIRQLVKTVNRLGE